MSDPIKEWTDQELYDLARRRKDLYPHRYQFDEGSWWPLIGPKHDLVVGRAHIQATMLAEANRILGREKNPHLDLGSAVAELDLKHPYKW